MTDLEICKRIAEIHIGELFTMSDSVYWTSDKNDEFNPLTDKALCFDLMVKHEIEVMFDDDNGGCMTSFFFRKSDTHISPICTGDKNPQRAICLAIIEKYEAEND